MRSSKERVAKIRDEIARHRRDNRAHLPAALWLRAAAVAHELGTGVAARALGVSYESLRRHVRGSEKNAFVEVGRFATPTDGGAGTIEVEDGGGARMTIRLGDGQVDIVALVRAFRGER